MVRKLSIRLLERLYQQTQKKHHIIHEKIEEYKHRAVELKKQPDEKVIQQYLNRPGLNVWLAEDCAGYKRGKEIEEKEIQNIIQQGYETVWVSDMPVKDYLEDDSKYSKLMEYREELINRLADIYVSIDEKDAGHKKKGSKIDLLDGRDLLSLKIDPLQKEGAGRLASKIFSETGVKLEPIRTLIDKIMKLNLNRVNLKDNRTLGNIHVDDKEDLNKRRQVSNYLVMHSVSVGILFTITLHNMQKNRLESGSQSSTARYTAGQKYKKEYRVSYDQNVVNNACLASFIFDIGFNHSQLNQILQKEMKELISPEGQAIHKGFTMVNDYEYSLLKKHVNVGAHILQNLGVDSTSIISNMIRTHHCYLNGEGYPKRKGSDFEIVLTDESGNKTQKKVHRYATALHELTNLLSIIDTYDAMINRRPWRLPISRHDAVEYLLENSSYHYNPDTGKIDEKGIFTFGGTEHREKKYDRHLVDMFLKSIQCYAKNEVLPLRDVETNKKITEAIVAKYTDEPNRPIVRIKVKDKVHEIDLSAEKYHKYYLGEYIVTTRKTKKNR